MVPTVDRKTKAILILKIITRQQIFVVVQTLINYYRIFKNQFSNRIPIYVGFFWHFHTTDSAEILSQCSLFTMRLSWSRRFPCTRPPTENSTIHIWSYHSWVSWCNRTPACMAGVPYWNTRFRIPKEPCLRWPTHARARVAVLFPITWPSEASFYSPPFWKMLYYKHVNTNQYNYQYSLSTVIKFYKLWIRISANINIDQIRVST